MGEHSNRIRNTLEFSKLFRCYGWKAYCYKAAKKFRFVLLALLDANYKFIYVDVGCNGRISDGGVYCNSSLLKATENCLLGIPLDRIIAEGMEALPHVILIDDAFRLRLIS